MDPFVKLKKSEIWGALILLALHAIIFPIVAGFCIGFNTPGWDSARINLAYYCLSFCCTLLLMGNFLHRNFNALCDNPGRVIKTYLLGWLIYLGAAMAAGVILNFIDFGGANPNDSAVMDMVDINRRSVFVIGVLLAPIVEETIFRGGIFGSIRPKSRLLAYAASIALFSLYHVWQFAFFYNDLRYLIFALQYIPISLTLCWCYDRSGSLWTSIALHMTFNLIGIMLS